MSLVRLVSCIIVVVVVVTILYVLVASPSLPTCSHHRSDEVFEAVVTGLTVIFLPWVAVRSCLLC